MDNYGDLHKVGYEACEGGGWGGRGGESFLPASLPISPDRGRGCEEGSLGEGGGGEKALVFPVHVFNLFDLNTCNATPKSSNYSKCKYDCFI